MIVAFVSGIYYSYFSPQRVLYTKMVKIAGFYPVKFSCYTQALRHHSISNSIHHSGVRDSNERLEYLGDSVLNTIVADLLFARFPFKDEGFLTEMRSKIVSRESLNDLAQKIGLNELVAYDKRAVGMHIKGSIFGNALEAFIGAVFLDRGFKGAQQFIKHKLLPHIDIDKLEVTEKNFKGKLIEWTQKNNHTIDFESDEEISRKQKIFKVRILVNGELVGAAEHISKKKAEQLASEKACELLNLVL
ncbi:MAG: ribonuclease III [Bacteroidia bacterium]|nr:ribonuclease III [Bacteroidia bacterium]